MGVPVALEVVSLVTITLIPDNAQSKEEKEQHNLSHVFENIGCAPHPTKTHPLVAWTLCSLLRVLLRASPALLVGPSSILIVCDQRDANAMRAGRVRSAIKEVVVLAIAAPASARVILFVRFGLSVLFLPPNPSTSDL